VISASGSSCSRRSAQRARAESLPPLHERAKAMSGGSSAGAAVASGSHDSWGGRDWIVRPFMKNLRVCGGRGPAASAARTALPPRARRSFGAERSTWLVPVVEHRSCGTAPDSYRTSPFLHRPGVLPADPSIRHHSDRGWRLKPEAADISVRSILNPTSSRTSLGARSPVSSVPSTPGCLGEPGHYRGDRAFVAQSHELLFVRYAYLQAMPVGVAPEVKTFGPRSDFHVSSDNLTRLFAGTSRDGSDGTDGTRTRDLRRDRPVRGIRRLATMSAQSLYSCGLRPCSALFPRGYEGPSSRSERSPIEVEPTRSQKRTVTVLRTPAGSSTGSGAAQAPQKRKPVGFSSPQLGQTSTA
jgi:hypothetical protein